MPETLADFFIKIRHLKNSNFEHQTLIKMSAREIKDEVNRVLDHFSDKALSELLKFLKELDSKNDGRISSNALLNKILQEDKELLTKLAQ